mmetsp:Transcript_3406/g.4669  ORF Transcript_3406/g.4669 Transcript_3406/m.4669 type:complete len:169 (+) Transcript_3406:197-703(+)
MFSESSAAKTGIVCAICFLLIFGNILNIASIVVGVRHMDEDDVCKTSLKNGANLATWLLYGGAVNLAAYSLMVILLGCMLAASSESGIATSASMVIGISAGIGLFDAIWCILGIILLSTVENSCKNSQPDTFAMSILLVILFGLGVMQTAWRPSSYYRERTAYAEIYA